MTNGEIPVDGVIDAHVHLMPDRLMTAIQKALNDAAGWERCKSRSVPSFLTLRMGQPEK